MKLKEGLKKMKIIDCEQRSEEWFSIRRGIPTSSNFDKIVTSKGEPSKQREKYLYRLAGEVVSKSSEETYQNAVMIRGMELEPEAKNMYELVTGNAVQDVGFCMADGDYKYGSSPDGLVGEDGNFELKCPVMATHVGYLLKNKLPTDYFQQVQGSLLVTGREWCDFVSYYPGIKPLIIRVERDKTFISKLKTELERFCILLDVTVGRIE